MQRQQWRDEPVKENTHLVLDTLASRLRELSLNCRSWELSILGHKCYSPTLRDCFPMDLVNFSLFISSNCFRLQTVKRFPTGTHLSHTLHHFINICLPHSKPCFIKPNLILDSSFPCCAWLCCHTCTLHILCFFFYSATAMWLHPVINLHYACSR